MKSSQGMLVCILVLSSACSQNIRIPPDIERPEPTYVPAGAPSEAAWDAVIDVLADFGLDFDYISPDMRFAKISGVIARGPVVIVREEGRFLRPGVADTLPEPSGLEWADCGSFNGRELAGWGDLFASFSIRVRNHQGEGIVKVVVPEMWQTTPSSGLAEPRPTNVRVDGAIRRFPCRQDPGPSGTDHSDKRATSRRFSWYCEQRIADPAVETRSGGIALVPPVVARPNASTVAQRNIAVSRSMFHYTL